nr:hypothetical protein BaRGS_029676 [Batillaria attramentaria]
MPLTGTGAGAYAALRQAPDQDGARHNRRQNAPQATRAGHNTRSKNPHLQNSNNNFRQQPATDASSRRDHGGGIFRSFHSSRRLDDVIRSRPTSQCLLPRDSLFVNPAPAQFGSQSKSSVFSSPRRPNLGIKQKVLKELNPDELVRGQGEDEDEAAAASRANQRRDESGGDGNEAEEEEESASSWSVIVMVVAASVRLFCDLWERNFDILTFDDDDVPSVSGSTEL